jgi:hypothetical protein
LFLFFMSVWSSFFFFKCLFTIFFNFTLKLKYKIYFLFWFWSLFFNCYFLKSFCIIKILL